MRITLSATVSIKKIRYFSSRTYFSAMYGIWGTESIENDLDNLLAHVKRKDENNTSIRGRVEKG